MSLPFISNCKTPLILAPMEGITDAVFRRICLEFGCDTGISEFISSEAIIRNVEKSLKKMFSDSETDLRWVQIFGNNPNTVAEAAKIAEANGADIIDLNFGCPAKKVVSKGNGAALLKDLPLMTKIAEATLCAVNVPITAKTRLGWDESSIVIFEVEKILSNSGIASLAIHGRTRAQQYGGSARWEHIAQIKQTSKIPIIVNGDIKDVESAKSALKITNADAIMIGRAAIGNPWLFTQIKAALNDSEVPAISIKEKIDTAHKHLVNTLKFKPERCAVVEMRKHYSHYFKGLADFKTLKMELLSALSIGEVNAVFEKIKDKYL